MRNKLKFGDFIIIGVVLVMAGALAAGDALPSMLLLAKELRISVITTKRAYEELEQAGFIRTIPAKGSYVAENNTAQIREGYLAQIEEHFSAVLPLATSCGLGEEELVDLLRQSYQADQDAKGGPR